MFLTVIIVVVVVIIIVVVITISSMESNGKNSTVEKSVLKNKREICWKSRDEYFEKCKNNSNDKEICERLKEAFHRDCPKSWVGTLRKNEFFKR